jgi:uncharacterized protein DUF4838
MILKSNSDAIIVSYCKKSEATYNYAVIELLRMLTKAEITVDSDAALVNSAPYKIIIGKIAPASCNIKAVQYDGYTINVATNGIALLANSAKGILNAVYDLMERLGYLFLLPGDAGEWAPTELKTIPEGSYAQNPRFPWRGVFREEAGGVFDYSPEAWFEFYAKLRFNAVTLDRPELLPLAEKLGLRMEIGGHGFSELLPRELFAEKPELFRMFQPEDFNGKRMPDANLCITNPATKRLVKENFREKLSNAGDVYAFHLWPDDLPAGGWCLCPSCRAFTPEDQATLAMRTIADEAKSVGSNTRIPLLAYHDTMTPGPEIEVSDNMFLLFAPRERCYAHALDDPQCTRNRFYLDALTQWMGKFKGVDDAHTFEYYFDQILFRGMHPYLPSVIARDMTVYEQAGIECHFSLQVASNCIAPEYNMLFFAAAHWHSDSFTPENFANNLAQKATPELAEIWSEYLTKRSEVFVAAMRMCDHNIKIYLDYRWLPESRSDFSKDNAAIYLDASDKLVALRQTLADSLAAIYSPRVSTLVNNEMKRLAFESAEFKVMHYQQLAVNSFAEYQNSERCSARDAGIEFMESAIAALEESLTQALEFGLSPDGWYARNINGWLTREFKAKIASNS